MKGSITLDSVNDYGARGRFYGVKLAIVQVEVKGETTIDVLTRGLDNRWQVSWPKLKEGEYLVTARLLSVAFSARENYSTHS